MSTTKCSAKRMAGILLNLGRLQFVQVLTPSSQHQLHAALGTDLPQASANRMGGHRCR